MFLKKSQSQSNHMWRHKESSHRGNSSSIRELHSINREIILSQISEAISMQGITITFGDLAQIIKQTMNNKEDRLHNQFSKEQHRIITIIL